GRVALATVTIAGLTALEHRRQIARVVVAERDRGMDGLVQRTVLDALLAVAVQRGGGKTVFFLVVHGWSVKRKKPDCTQRRAQSGLDRQGLISPLAPGSGPVASG